MRTGDGEVLTRALGCPASSARPWLRRRAQGRGPTPRARALTRALGVSASFALTALVAVSPAPAQAPGAGPSPGATPPLSLPAPVTSSGPCALARLHLRCPDLVMSAPSHLELDRSTEPGRVLLRAASSIDNVGAGPLELRGNRQGATMRVTQAIYDRSGRAHLFPTRGKLVFKYVPGDRYGGPGVGDFTYWKFRYAATFELWALGAGRRGTRLVRTGPKLVYCFRDLLRTHPSPVSPAGPVYGACNQNPGLQHDTLGTSVGWSDVYPYEYPQQWIDVTGLRGRFAYVQVADPRGLIFESNERNNLSETYVALPSGRVLGQRVAESRP